MSGWLQRFFTGEEISYQCEKSSQGLETLFKEGGLNTGRSMILTFLPDGKIKVEQADRTPL